MIKKGFKIRQIEYVCGSGFILLLLLTALVLRVTPAFAQGSQQLLTTISQQIGQSMQALTGYSHQQMTEVQVNREIKSAQLVQVAFE